MNARQSRPLLVILILVALLIALGSLLWRTDESETVGTGPGGPEVVTTPSTNAAGDPSAATSTNAAATGVPNTVAPEVGGGGSNVPAPATITTEGPVPPAGDGGGPATGTNTVTSASTNTVQLSFQGARIEMVIDWLAKTTGKSVVKHPRVQCQLTIVSSNPLPIRDALSLVYQALALEGFTTVESRDAILIVPEGQDPKLPPELLMDGQAEIPDGRQPLIKVFPLEHVEAGELSERIRIVLSDTASVDVDSRSNQLIVTDTTENIRLVTELIRELDVVSPSDTVVELYPLKHVPADELAELLGLILNAKAGAVATPSRSPTPSPARPTPGRPVMPGSEGPTSPVVSGGSVNGASAGGREDVRLWADRTVNRLIVAAPQSRVAEIKELIDVLDQEKPQDVTLRVIPLQHVIAQDLVREIAPLYQKMSGQSLKDTIEVAANSRANSLIVLSGEGNYKAIRSLVATLDTENAQAKVMRAFPLKNADAEDVARQLQELNEESGPASRYIYYLPSRPGSETAKLTVVADRRRNTVVVQAPPAAMESVAEMIAILDEPVTDESLAPRIFPLRYVSATDIEDVLNELFVKRQQERSYYDFIYYDYYGGSSSSQDQNAGRMYGKVRITSEPYSNSIIVTSNSPENLNAVESVLKQLDVPSQAGETTVRLELRFGQAIEIAKSVNILFAKAGSPPLRPTTQPGMPQDARAQQPPQRSGQSGFELEAEQVEEAYYPWIGGQQESYRSLDGRSTVRPISDLVGRVRVVPDRRSNSLLITSNVHLLPQVLKLIRELDVPTPQVLLEARIVAVGSDFREKLGVRWSPDGSQVFSQEDMDNSILANVDAQYRNVFLGGALPDALRSGVLDSTVNLDFLIQFLQKNVELKVLAEPQINVADNEIGRLFVGSQVPTLNSSLNTDVGGRNDSYVYRDVGIILEVTPHINNDQEVTLRVRTESSNIRDGELLLGGAIFDTRDFRTEVTVKSGETLVLGGIIQTEQGLTVRKVPLLGDIPLLGYLFKKKDSVSRETELIVFLRPQVSRTPEEAAEMLEEVQRRAPLIRDWTRELDAQREAAAAEAATDHEQRP